MNARTHKLVLSAMLAALVFVATMIIKIPSPMKGYLNLGDCIVLLCGWILPPFYGLAAAGVGSALADVVSGYMIYAPATFVIKGLMAVIAHSVFAVFAKKAGRLSSRILGGVLAESVMVLGYFLFEGLLYGFLPSVVNVPANIVQGVAGVIIGTVLIVIIKKQNLINLL